MSLINTMLKDLEKREKRQRDTPYIAIANTHRKTSIFTNSKKLMIVGLIFSILAILFSTLFLNKKTQPIASFQIAEPVTQSPRPLTALDQTWLKPVSITGVTLQVKDNITEVTFLLDHAALYRLVSDEMQNQLSVIVERSQLQSELPPVNYLSTAIERINTKTINGDTKFTLAFIPGAKLKYVNLNDNNANAELVIAIEYQPIERMSSQTNQPEKSIKTPALHNLLTQQYQAALLAAEGGNYQSAIQHLGSLLKIDPSFKDARMSLVALLIDQGSPLKAKHLVDEGLNANPDYVPFIELKARILATEGNSKQALALLQTASPRIDENPDYHAFVAAMYEQNSQFSLAANIYRQLLNQNPNNGSWWFGLGVSLDKQGKNKDAINAYIKASTEGHLNPESLAYLQTRLQKLQEMTDVKE